MSMYANRWILIILLHFVVIPLWILLYFPFFPWLTLTSSCSRSDVTHLPFGPQSHSSGCWWASSLEIPSACQTKRSWNIPHYPFKILFFWGWLSFPKASLASQLPRTSIPPLNLFLAFREIRSQIFAQPPKKYANLRSLFNLSKLQCPYLEDNNRRLLHRIAKRIKKHHSYLALRRIKDQKMWVVTILSF